MISVGSDLLMRLAAFDHVRLAEIHGHLAAEHLKPGVRQGDRAAVASG